MAVSNIKLIQNYFGMTLQQMKAEWSTMPAEDKEQILTGIADGTETY